VSILNFYPELESWKNPWGDRGPSVSVTGNIPQCCCLVDTTVDEAQVAREKYTTEYPHVVDYKSCANLTTSRTDLEIHQSD